MEFSKQKVLARFQHPSGEPVEKVIEIRKNPITGRTSRISLARIEEKEPGIDRLPDPPPNAEDRTGCPFCRPSVFEKTPGIRPEISSGEDRFVLGESILFPNLFPYGEYSAVSLFDNRHFVEIGTASLESYTNCFLNCANYLKTIRKKDPDACYMAITQNHLPSAGGSLLHPHLQINADRVPANFHRDLAEKAARFHDRQKGYILSEYLACEKKDGSRLVGKTGNWEWLAAFAPEGFFEIWGILPGIFSLLSLTDSDWHDLADGVLRTQRFYRSIHRNGYNLGVLFVEDGSECLEIRVIIIVRSSYAAWVRNDHTGFEVMLGDMTTFVPPEKTAEFARPFWQS